MCMNAVEALNCYPGLVRESHIEQKENDRAGFGVTLHIDYVKDY